MGRPRKQFRVKIDLKTTSIKFFKLDEYLGCVSMRVLCRLIQEYRAHPERYGTKGVSAQLKLESKQGGLFPKKR